MPKKPKQEPTISVSDIVFNNVQRGHKHAHAFKRIFGVSIGQYMDKITGFDIIAFDENVVKPGENESTKDAIKRQWGDEAVTLILALLK